jgi:hypothetical protein
MRVRFGKCREKMQIAGREGSSSIHDTADCRAIGTSKSRTQLEGDVRQSGLD